jgi:hypothetical protein
VVPQAAVIAACAHAAFLESCDLNHMGKDHCARASREALYSHVRCEGPSSLALPMGTPCAVCW